GAAVQLVGIGAAGDYVDAAAAENILDGEHAVDAGGAARRTRAAGHVEGDAGGLRVIDGVDAVGAVQKIGAGAGVGVVVLVVAVERELVAAGLEVLDVEQQVDRRADHGI